MSFVALKGLGFRIITFVALKGLGFRGLGLGLGISGLECRVSAATGQG